MCVRTAEAILLRRQHLDEWSAARQEGGQRLRLRIRQGAQRRAQHLGEVRQHLGIEGVGFGQLPRGFGKIAHLPRVDHDDRHPRGRQDPRDRDLQSAGGFQDHERRGRCLQAFEDLCKPRFIIGCREPSLRSKGHIQLRFGHIYPDKDLCTRHPILLGGPALHDTGSMAQATVRALPVKGMTTLAVPRSLRTSALSVYHARVDDEPYHYRTRSKIQGTAENVRASPLACARWSRNAAQ